MYVKRLEKVYRGITEKNFLTFSCVRQGVTSSAQGGLYISVASLFRKCSLRIKNPQNSQDDFSSGVMSMRFKLWHLSLHHHIQLEQQTSSFVCCSSCNHINMTSSGICYIVRVDRINVIYTRAILEKAIVRITEETPLSLTITELFVRDRTKLTDIRTSGLSFTNTKVGMMCGFHLITV